MASPKNLLIISPDYYPSVGGVEKFTRDLTTGLSKERFNIRVLCGSRLMRDLNTIQVDNVDNIAVTRIPTFAPGGMDFPKKIRYYLTIFKELKNSDIVHLNDVRVFFTSAIIGKIIFNYRLVLTSHGFIFHTKRHRALKKIYTLYFVKMLSWFCNQVITVGKIDQDVCQKYKLPAKIIEEGINLEYYRAIQRQPQKGNFLYFGRIDLNKNLPTLIHTLHAFSQQDTAFRLILCGSGSSSHLEQLKATIESLQMEKYVELKGKVSEAELASHIASAEFVFLPSLFESFGYTLVEAMAAGCTVIAHRNEQFQTMIGQTQAAYLVDMGNQDIVCTTIQKARSEYHSTRMLAINLAKQYDFRCMIDAYATVFGGSIRT